MVLLPIAFPSGSLTMQKSVTLYAGIFPSLKILPSTALVHSGAVLVTVNEAIFVRKKACLVSTANPVTPELSR